MATNGASYIIKGPDIATVFAEHAGYELADILGLPVPEHALCTAGDGQVYFASQKLPYRFAVDDLIGRGRVSNREALPRIAVFDVWIANEDRNPGNFVAGPDDQQPGMLRMYAIDFEKAHALNGRTDQFTVAGVPSKAMMPKEQLGVLCKMQSIPTDLGERINQCGDIFHAILENWHADIVLPRITWADRAESILSQRADRIRSLLTEAWG